MTLEPRRAGGARAPEFDAIYREQVTYVWNALQRLRVPPADVEDLAHDVFVVVHNRLHSYDANRPLRPWLFGIAYRVASQQRRRKRPTGQTDSAAVADDTARAPDARADERALVLAGLEELSLDQRAALIMHDLDGYTAPEIAHALECPLNTVYSRVRLARAKFVLAIRRFRGDAA